MTFRRILSLAVLGAALAAPALAATPVWSGDLETGDFSQWSPLLDVHAGTTDRLVVVDEPVREGRHALKATVKFGDINNLGARAELVLKDVLFREGDERWFHWYTLFPVDFVTSPKWHLFTQWHSSDFGVPLAFNLHGETMSFRVMGHAYDDKGDWTGGTLWTAPLERGHWNEFLLHVMFSDDPGKGFVELWKDGAQVVPRTFHETLYPADYVYLKHGLYRDKTIDWDQTLYHDGMRVFAEDPRPAGGPTTPPPFPPPSLPGDPDPAPAPTPDPPAPLPLPEPGAGSTPPIASEGCGSGNAALALMLPIPWAARRARRRRRAKNG